jgi:Rrf2 family iron-sulfur cluster assembly transcriptional regulator
VDLGLSSRGRYVVRAALFLADAYGSGGVRTRREVSEAMGVPGAFVPQVLGDLVRSGLVVSISGVGGGYRLARAPGEVRLLDVVEAGEGLHCVAGSTASSQRSGSRVQELWTEASARFRRALSVMTLAELVDRAGQGAPDVERPPCGVLAVSGARAGLAHLRRLADGPFAEHLAEELVERRRDRVGVSPRARGRRGSEGEQDAVEKDSDQ